MVVGNTKRFIFGLVAVAATAFGETRTASAVTLLESLTPTTYDVQAGIDRSWDGTSIDNHLIAQLIEMEFISSYNVSRIGVFQGDAVGSILSVQYLYGVADLDNRVGLVDADGNNFREIGNTTAGEAASIVLEANEAVQLALCNWYGVFSSTELAGEFGQPLILGFEFIRSGSFQLAGLPGRSFDVVAGRDVLFVVEDLFGFPVTDWSDFDYNDMAGIISQTAIPEPASMTLLGIGALAAAAKRRRKQA